MLLHIAQLKKSMKAHADSTIRAWFCRQFKATTSRLEQEIGYNPWSKLAVDVDRFNGCDLDVPRRQRHQELQNYKEIRCFFFETELHPLLNLAICRSWVQIMRRPNDR